MWFSALHEIPYFIMMKLLFLLPCDFFFFEVKFSVCVVSCPSECLLVSHSTPHLTLNKLFTCFMGSMVIH